jgi:hypothetical protein
MMESFTSAEVLRAVWTTGAFATASRMQLCLSGTASTRTAHRQAIIILKPKMKSEILARVADGASKTQQVLMYDADL